MIKYLMCVVGGVAVGYAIAHSKLEDEFLRRLDKETEDAKDFYRRKYEKKLEEKVASPEFVKAAQEAAEALEMYQGRDTAPVEISEEQMELDEESDPDVDVTVEVAQPEPAKLPFSTDIPGQAKTGGVNYNKVSTPEPTTVKKEDEYVPDFITMDEFVRNETNYRQYSITYFHGDDTLAGESDQVVDLDVRNITLGREVLEMLKAGPEAMGGETTLYLRNNQQHVEIDISWSPGKYTEEVGPIRQQAG